MINRILMELYDDYEKGNIDSLIDFTKKTLPSDGTDKLFIGCTLIMFSISSSRYYATREELLSIVKAVKEKLGDSNYLAFYVDRVNKEKGISKYLKEIVNDENDFYTFYGESKGTLSLSIRGNIGRRAKSNLWSVFIPLNHDKTLAEMSDYERSHRHDGHTSATDEFINWYENMYLKNHDKTLNYVKK